MMCLTGISRIMAASMEGTGVIGTYSSVPMVCLSREFKCRLVLFTEMTQQPIRYGSCVRTYLSRARVSGSMLGSQHGDSGKTLSLGLLNQTNSSAAPKLESKPPAGTVMTLRSTD